MTGKFRLEHLTAAQHMEAALLLRDVQDRLRALTKIVGRAPFSDETMRQAKGIQERLVDPLREAASEADVDLGELGYPSVYYAVGRR